MIKLPNPLTPKIPKAALKLIAYRNGEILLEKELTQKKMLIGSMPHADVVLKSEHSSHYHAFLIIEDGGGTVVDLASENGTYINGERVDRAFFAAGDTLRFADIEFHVEELIDKASAVIDHDEKVQKLDEQFYKEKLPELPPLPGLTVIDGEYCDIVFDEDDFTPISDVPIYHADLAPEHYVDQEQKDEEVLPIRREVNEDALEVLVLTNGVILSVDYFPLNSTIYASSLRAAKNTLHIPGLAVEDDIIFIKGKKKGSVSVHALPGFSCLDNKTRETLSLGDGQHIDFRKQDFLSFNHGTIQVMVRQVQAPSRLRGTPFFGRDREAKKQMIQVFAGIMSLALLILLIDVTVTPPEKEIAVIYREAIKAPEPSNERSSETVSEVDTQTGIKPTEQSEEAPRQAAQAAAQAPAKKEPTPPTPAPAQQQAEAAPAQEAPQEAVQEMQAYQFQMRTNVANMMNNNRPTPTDVQAPSRNPAAIQGFQASAESSASDLRANATGQIGSLGQDFAGDYDTSAGAQGLASKKGIDTTYIDPKTVVLGSMDPELLRRILQEYLPQFRHCYQQELERQGDLLQGIVDMNFRIGADGKVSRVNIRTKNSAFSERGVNCMAGVLRIIDFPKPKGGGVVDVRQPLNFSSSRARI
jgi:outer membrane biosynthesis protein TonB